MAERTGEQVTITACFDLASKRYVSLLNIRRYGRMETARSSPSDGVGHRCHGGTFTGLPGWIRCSKANVSEHFKEVAEEEPPDYRLQGTRTGSDLLLLRSHAWLLARRGRAPTSDAAMIVAVTSIQVQSQGMF